MITWAQVTESEHINCPIITTRRRTGQNATDLVSQAATLLTPKSQAGGRLALTARPCRAAPKGMTKCREQKTMIQKTGTTIKERSHSPR